MGESITTSKSIDQNVFSLFISPVWFSILTCLFAGWLDYTFACHYDLLVGSVDNNAFSSYPLPPSFSTTKICYVFCFPLTAKKLKVSSLLSARTLLIGCLLVFVVVSSPELCLTPLCNPFWNLGVFSYFVCCHPFVWFKVYRKGDSTVIL